MRVKTIVSWILLIVFSFSAISWSGTIQNIQIKNGRYVLKYSGDVKCYKIKLSNPDRYVLDIVGVDNKCKYCDGKNYELKDGLYLIDQCWHRKGKDSVSKLYGKSVLRVSFVGVDLKNVECKNDTKSKAIVVKYGNVGNKKQRTDYNEIERVSLRSFKTYEMVVFLLKKKPVYRFNKTGNVILITINDTKATNVALKAQDVSNESENVKTILAVKPTDTSVRYIINLKNGAKFKRYYSDKRHIYVIFAKSKTLANLSDYKMRVNNTTKVSKPKQTNISDTSQQYKKILGMDRKISFDVRDAELKDVFRVFAQISGLNFIIGQDVKGTLTMKLKDVPLDQALSLILQQEGLVAERKGNVVIIMTAQKYRREKNQELEALKEKEKLERMKNAITKVINLNYVTPDYAIKIVNKLLYNSEKGNSGGFIVSDVKNNALICHDTRDNIDKIQRIVSIIDQKKRAVEIDARIVEISKSFERQLGIQWGGNFFNQNINHSKTFVGIGGSSSPVDVSGGLPPSESFSNDNFMVNLPAGLSEAPTSSLSLAIGNVMANYNLDLKLTMGELEGYSKVLSTPKVITLDNEPAKISSGQEIPYQESAGASGATSVSFKEATLSLEVTPHITRNDQVILKLKIKKDSPDYSHSVGGEPPVNTNEVDSTIILNDGQTIVIGGLMQSTTQKTISGVPVLMRIPLLGWLFKTKRIYNPKNELYIFVTPHIIKQ